MSMRQAEVRVMTPSRITIEKTLLLIPQEFPTLRKERARVGHPFSGAAKESAVELCSTGRANAPVPTWTLPLSAFIGRKCCILAGHLRDGAWIQGCEKAADACGIVLLVGREDDQEEAVFRGRRKSWDVEDRVVRHGEAVEGEHAENGGDSGEENR